MKYESALQANMVPNLKEYYIRYEALKRLIYQSEQRETDTERKSLDMDRVGGRPLAAADMEAGEIGAAEPLLSEPLLSARMEASEQAFIAALEEDLKNVHSCVLKKEGEYMQRWQEADLAVQSAEANFMHSKPEEARRFTRQNFWRQPMLQGQRDTLVFTLHQLYLDVYDLNLFIKHNSDGFRKILKKHDKVLSTRPLRERFMPMVTTQLVPKLEKLDTVLQDIINIYAVLTCQGDADEAFEHLSHDCRKQIEYERQTIWNDRIEEERKQAAVNVLLPKGANKVVAWYHELAQPACIAATAIIMLGVCHSGAFGDSDAGAARRSCLAILLGAAALWCTEAVPLYVTSMAVPLGVVVLRAFLDSNGDRMEPPAAMSRVFSKIFSQTIMLLLGGFTMAAALSKHLIAKRLAISVLNNVGRRPQNVLLASMGIALFSSMWISNVAAPVLCYSIIQPILRTLDSDNPLCAALVMGIAMASNIGGMTSPIASPQNIFAIDRMSMDGVPPSWLKWFAVSLPTSIICLLMVWRYILQVYAITKPHQEVRSLRQLDDSFTAQHAYIVGVCVVTMCLWCANTWIKDYVGGMGITALIPMIGFFGFGVLSKSDFESFPWSVVMLAMGGIVLGDAATSSGLLAVLANATVSLVEGLSVWEVLAIFSAVIGVVTSFISHTVGAMVILPIVQSIGTQMAQSTGADHSKLLVMGGALMCSGGMALPVSGFPNMSASNMQDPTGRVYVTIVDFLKTGIPATFMAWVAVVLVGYPLMYLTGM